MATEQTETTTLAAVAAMVERLHEQHNEDRVPLPWCNALATDLGIGAACTGDPRTVEQSRQYNPKTGFTFGFYYVLPGYRNDTRELVRVGYVGQWRGVEYRGEVVGTDYLTESGPRFYDATRYAATLPDGCRKLITSRVAASAADVGVTVAALEAEKDASNRASAIYSATYTALRELRNAAEIEAGGRF
jgi:hypothetical protein